MKKQIAATTNAELAIYKMGKQAGRTEMLQKLLRTETAAAQRLRATLGNPELAPERAIRLKLTENRLKSLAGILGKELDALDVRFTRTAHATKKRRIAAK